MHLVPESVLDLGHDLEQACILLGIHRQWQLPKLLHRAVNNHTFPSTFEQYCFWWLTFLNWLQRVHALGGDLGLKVERKPSIWLSLVSVTCLQKTVTDFDPSPRLKSSLPLQDVTRSSRAQNYFIQTNCWAVPQKKSLMELPIPTWSYWDYWLSYLLRLFWEKPKLE